MDIGDAIVIIQSVIRWVTFLNLKVHLKCLLLHVMLLSDHPTYSHHLNDWSWKQSKEGKDVKEISKMVLDERIDLEKRTELYRTVHKRECDDAARELNLISLLL